MPRWVVVASIVVVGVLFSSVRSAGAHAVLESSNPADQSVLATSPTKVTLTFGEAVTITSRAIRVFDSRGDRVDEGVATHDASADEVEIGLKPDLPDGTYAVAWRVISADSHPIHGGLVFSVGAKGAVGGLDQYLTTSSQPMWEAVGDALRAICYLAAFVVVGGVVFGAFAETDAARRRRVDGVLGITGIVAVLAAAAQVPVDAILAADLGPGSLFRPGVAAQVLGGGVALTLTGVSLAVLVALATRWARSIDQLRIGAVASVALLAGAFVASGHTRSTDPEWLVSVVDAVHVIGGAVWVGGLAVLIWTLLDRRGGRHPETPSDPGDAATVVVRFSRIATGAILGIGGSGLVLGWFQVGSLSGLVSTGYGRLVLAKVGSLALIAALGAYNHFRLVPAVQAEPDRRAGWARLGRAVRLEAIGMVVILALTGVLVNAIPSRTVESKRALYSATAPLGSGSVNLVIDPARTGPTALHLYLLDAQGRSDDEVRSIDVQLTQAELDIGPITRPLRKAGPGHYLVNESLFTVPGTWTVIAEVRVDEFTENTATFQVKVRG